MKDIILQALNANYENEFHKAEVFQKTREQLNKLAVGREHNKNRSRRQRAYLN